MTFKLPAVLTLSIILLTNCRGHIAEDINIQPVDKQVLLFSSDDNRMAEEHYYDALLDLRSEFPEEFKNIKIINESSVWINNDLVEFHQHPALLLIENNQIIAKIEGAIPRQKITEQLKQALNGKETSINIKK